MLLFHFVPFGGRALDNAFLDASSRHPFRTPPLPRDSAIVLVDDATLQVLSQRYGMRWPLPRRAFAGLVAALDRAGAKRIVMDFIFLEESESAEQDLQLAAIAAVSPRVVLGGAMERGPVFWSAEFQKAHPQFFQVPRTGHTDYEPDEDGVMRRYRATGSLAAAALDAPTQNTGGLLRWRGGLAQIAQRGVPVVSAANFIIPGLDIASRLERLSEDYSPDVVAQGLAAEPALTGPACDLVRGRTVFVGTNANATFDLKEMPVGKLEPGVLVHWTAWTNLVENDFISRFPRWIALLAAGLGIALVLAAASRGSGLAAPAVVAVVFTLVAIPTAYVLLSFGWFFPPATPATAAMLALLGVSAEKFWAEQARKREMQLLFGAYVDQGVVEQFIRNPGSIELGGERRDASVFFSDLVGFTTLSEKLPAQEMFKVVNAYLEETSECLLNHGAYVDKYIGDAVMAVFGVPNPLPNHALAACLAALEAQGVIDGINRRYAEQTGVVLAVRIGINSGDLLVGNVGSSRKKSYTVMGDTVNLASRLEGANKAFGTQILIGPETALAVQGAIVTRPLARLRVKGKYDAVEVHTLVGLPGALTAAQGDFVAAYRAGFDAYVGRRFPEAAEALSRADALQPGDLTTRRLREEAARLAATPPPPDWEPILILDSK